MDIAFKAITDLKLDEKILYLLTGSTTFWAIRERRLRKRETKDMKDLETQIQEFEAGID